MDILYALTAFIRDLPPDCHSQHKPLKKQLFRAQYRAVRAPAISNYGAINYKPIHETRAHHEKGRLGVAQWKSYTWSALWASAWTDVTGRSSLPGPPGTGILWHTSSSLSSTFHSRLWLAHLPCLSLSQRYYWGTTDTSSATHCLIDARSSSVSIIYLHTVKTHITVHSRVKWWTANFNNNMIPILF